MKRSILLVIVTVLLTVSTSNAQGLKLGGGVSYGNEINNIGLRADGVYSINKDLGVGATATYYLKKDGLSWVVVDVNAQYNLIKEKDLTVYGLAGLNLNFWSLSVDMGWLGNISTSGSDTGFNLGAGARKSIGNKLELFGEAKYVLSGAGFFSVGAGILFAIN